MNYINKFGESWHRHDHQHNKNAVSKDSKAQKVDKMFLISTSLLARYSVVGAPPSNTSSIVFQQLRMPMCNCNNCTLKVLFPLWFLNDYSDIAFECRQQNYMALFLNGMIIPLNAINYIIIILICWCRCA